MASPCPTSRKKTCSCPSGWLVLQLTVIGQVLPLAATTHTEVGTRRLHALRRCRQHLQQPGVGKAPSVAQNLEIEILKMQIKLGYYAELMPRIARWQAELFTMDLVGEVMDSASLWAGIFESEGRGLTMPYLDSRVLRFALRDW